MFFSQNRNKLNLLLALTTALSTKGADALKPKMISTRVVPGESVGLEVLQQEKVSSSQATFLGDCSGNAPFAFPLSGGSGRGAIGFDDDSAIELICNDGDVTLNTNETADFFGALSSDGSASDMKATSFSFEGVDTIGTDCQIHCSEASTDRQVIVVYRDDAQDEVSADVILKDDIEHVELTNDVVSTIDLSGETRAKQGQQPSSVTFEKGNKKGIQIKRSKRKDLALVHLAIKGSDGNTGRRTLVIPDKPKQQQVRQINVKTTEIDDNGDIKVSFNNLGPKGSTVKVAARIGVEIEGNVQEYVDVSAIVSTDDAEITINAGWMHNACEEHGKTGTEGEMEIHLLDVVASDPNNGFATVGRLSSKVNTGVGKGHDKKRLLCEEPTDDERKVNDNMRFGRKPEKGTPGVRRRLGGNNHKKIIVHGYCTSGVTFPSNQFANALVFTDPDQGSPSPGYATPFSVSHDQFAQKINTFAINNNLDGCGIIAHSQGGAAALHLYTYYWSCLDYSTSGSRMIQTVGTPYQGTPLAGNLAVLGDVFGVGCGYNYDLTTDGASSWLSGIPSWARSQVHYYTTSFKDYWWSYDYCHIATDLFLNDPDDGVIEKDKGQLYGGNNKGHKTGWCHGTGMAESAQYHDASRNSQMNSYAKY